VDPQRGEGGPAGCLGTANPTDKTSTRLNCTKFGQLILKKIV